MRYIKHKNMKDVCFEVYRKVGRDKVHGCWINIALGEPFPIGDRRGLATETITIKDPNEWEIFSDARAAKTRIKSS